VREVHVDGPETTLSMAEHLVLQLEDLLMREGHVLLKHFVRARGLTPAGLEVINVILPALAAYVGSGAVLLEGVTRGR
jgi:hypothetical protein